ncbi:hypothetical protein [Escherichia coli]|uniref:hypothetical protein n=1 Tax=Escherichia coli TaxID=562 RepID=UPI003F865514
MKRLIPILASAASMTIPVAAMADNIVCHGGWSIERHVTGSASSGFMSYMKDVGVIKLLHNGKLISQKRIQDIQQSVYQWICPYISRHLLSLNPLLACCRRYSRGER